jgi:hypothetical protein
MEFLEDLAGFTHLGDLRRVNPLAFRLAGLAMALLILHYVAGSISIFLHGPSLAVIGLSLAVPFLIEFRRDVVSWERVRQLAVWGPLAGAFAGFVLFLVYREDLSTCGNFLALSLEGSLWNGLFKQPVLITLAGLLAAVSILGLSGMRQRMPSVAVAACLLCFICTLAGLESRSSLSTGLLQGLLPLSLCLIPAGVLHSPFRMGST